MKELEGPEGLLILNRKSLLSRLLCQDQQFLLPFLSTVLYRLFGVKILVWMQMIPSLTTKKERKIDKILVSPGTSVDRTIENGRTDRYPYGFLNQYLTK